MKKEIAIQLKVRADQIAAMYSNPERGNNFAKETFAIEEIIPLSEYTAIVIFQKQPSGKKSLSFFYWLETGSGGFWKDFFVSDSHVLGMQKIAPYLQQVEQHNLKLNWEEKKLTLAEVA